PFLVTSEELELRPGERVELKLSVGEGSRYVGVLAAYRDLGEASWRYVVPVTAKELTRVELKLGQKGILNAGELLGKAGDAR
ncbi:type VI secretion system lipoprotein TssJ, partial [Pseudomonas aeruginosa]